MSNFIPRLKREIVGALPAVLFFFCVFQLLALTRSLILKEYDIEVTAFLNATIAALVVGKVVLVVDLLPFVNRFPDKPLVYNIVWKTFIYMIVALLVRYLEGLVPLLIEHGNLAAANSNHFNEVVWPHFWVVQIWLMVCFLLFCTIREFGRVLGRERISTMFFGPGRSGVA